MNFQHLLKSSSADRERKKEWHLWYIWSVQRRGDPGLVTVKGLELIKKADCIIYDNFRFRNYWGMQEWTVSVFM